MNTFMVKYAATGGHNTPFIGPFLSTGGFKYVVYFLRGTAVEILYWQMNALSNLIQINGGHFGLIFFALGNLTIFM